MSRPGSGKQAWRARNARTERSIDEAVAAVKAEERAKWEEKRKVARERHAAELAHAATITPEQIREARFVRDAIGWHQVVRVNGKSVTVATQYSWTDRIGLDKILEVRA